MLLPAKPCSLILEYRKNGGISRSSDRTGKDPWDYAKGIGFFRESEEMPDSLSSFERVAKYNYYPLGLGVEATVKEEIKEEIKGEVERSGEVAVMCMKGRADCTPYYCYRYDIKYRRKEDLTVRDLIYGDVRHEEWVDLLNTLSSDHNVFWFRNVLQPCGKSKNNYEAEKVHRSARSNQRSSSKEDYENAVVSALRHNCSGYDDLLNSQNWPKFAYETIKQRFNLFIKQKLDEHDSWSYLKNLSQGLG